MGCHEQAPPDKRDNTDITNDTENIITKYSNQCQVIGLNSKSKVSLKESCGKTVFINFSGAYHCVIVCDLGRLSWVLSRLVNSYCDYQAEKNCLQDIEKGRRISKHCQLPTFLLFLTESHD